MSWAAEEQKPRPCAICGQAPKQSSVGLVCGTPYQRFDCRCEEFVVYAPSTQAVKAWNERQDERQSSIGVDVGLE